MVSSVAGIPASVVVLLAVYVPGVPAAAKASAVAAIFSANGIWILASLL
jgi:hypothetical protein